MTFLPTVLTHPLAAAVVVDTTHRKPGVSILLYFLQEEYPVLEALDALFHALKVGARGMDLSEQ